MSQKITQQLGRALRPASPVLLAASGSLLLAIISVQVLGNRSDMGRFALVIASFVWLTSAWLTGYAIWRAVAAAFQRRARSELMDIVICSYFALILVFTGIYYKMSMYGDYFDAELKFNHYRYNAQKIRDNLRTGAGLPKDQRAFAGIESRFWSGVDWPVGLGRNPGDLEVGGSPVTPSDMLATATDRSIDDVVRFIPEARMAVLGDCLHYSVTTITTLGYGDIVPTKWYSRAVSDCEVLMGILIIGIALTLGLSGDQSSEQN